MFISSASPFETLPISHMRVQDIYIPPNSHQFGTPWSLDNYIPGNSAGALFGMVSSRDPFGKVG